MDTVATQTVTSRLPLETLSLSEILPLVHKSFFDDFPYTPSVSNPHAWYANEDDSRT